jgi:prepilin-type N-terminal cleavage/methylation domain-containing protein
LRRFRPHAGFTLTEVLITVAVILFIAAIVVPKVTNSQIAPRESAALASLNEIYSSEARYSALHPDSGFTPDLPTLANFNDPGGQRTIDKELASGNKTGYLFVYTPGEKVGGAIRLYSVTAVPEQVGVTGKRRFYSDQTGAIHYNSSGPADANSPVIQ